MAGPHHCEVDWHEKGDDDCPNYLLRLVAREVRKTLEASIFAPTPWESLRSILSLAATEARGVISHDRTPALETRT